jgi:hypothetical protein
MRPSATDSQPDLAPFVVCCTSWLADMLGQNRAFDLHALMNLVDRGCPSVLAARILVPLDAEARPCWVAAATTGKRPNITCRARGKAIHGARCMVRGLGDSEAATAAS